MIAAVLLSAALACPHQPLFTSDEVAQDERAVYAVSQDRHRLLRFFKDGTAPSVVVSTRFTITAFDVDGPLIDYAVDYGVEPLKQILVVTITGGAPAVLANDPYAAAQIAHDARYIYFSEDRGVTKQGWPMRSLWRYEKRTGAIRNLLNGPDVISGSDEDAFYFVVGPAPAAYILPVAKPDHVENALASGNISDAFVDGSAIYFARDGKIWRVSKSSSLPFAVALLPAGMNLLGVGANRIFTTAGATDICTGNLTQLPPAKRIAVDSCGVYQVIGDALFATPLPMPSRIDTVDPDPAGAATVVRLRGAGFDRLATVQIDGAEAAVVSASENELDVLVPEPHATGGTVTVRNRDGTCAATFLSFFKGQ